MRVTFVLPYAGLAGGIRVASIYARELYRRGHEVTVVSTPEPRPDLRNRLKRLLRSGWGTPGPVPHGHFDDVPFEHRVIDNGHRTIGADDVPDADVIVATWWETALWISDFPDSRGRKVHFIQHDETQFDFQDAREIEKTWHLRTYKIVVARWLEQLAAERYGVHDVATVPNGVDLHQFHAPPRGKQPVPRFGLMYAPHTFKGLDIALEAVRIARQSESQIEFLAFGAHDVIETHLLPPDAAYYKAPQQEQIRDLYAGCDAWLFNSRSEGFGLPLLESMACRTPVIATPAGAAPELLAGGGGIEIEHQNPLSTADAMLEIVRMNDADWRSLSDAAYATALRHTWEASYIKFERHLLHAAEGGHVADLDAATTARAG